METSEQTHREPVAPPAATNLVAPDDGHAPAEREPACAPGRKLAPAPGPAAANLLLLAAEQEVKAVLASCQSAQPGLLPPPRGAARHSHPAVPGGIRGVRNAQVSGAGCRGRGAFEHDVGDSPVEFGGLSRRAVLADERKDVEGSDLKLSERHFLFDPAIRLRCCRIGIAHPAPHGSNRGQQGCGGLESR